LPSAPGFAESRLSAKGPKLYRELGHALGKEAHALPRAGTRQRGPCFAESRHSAKRPMLCREQALGKRAPVCRVPGQVLGKGAVTATQPTGSILFFAEGPVCSRQIVCRAPEKGLSAKPPLPTENLPRGLCREPLSANSLPRGFVDLPSASGTRQICCIR
jgi:hypothetical protein